MSQTIIKEKDDYFTVRLTGNYTGGRETDELRDILKDISQKEKNKVMIDLQEVEHIVSPILGIFLSANANFSQNNGKMVLLNPNTYLSDMFKITKLADVISIVYSIHDAKQELGIA